MEKNQKINHKACLPIRINCSLYLQQQRITEKTNKNKKKCTRVHSGTHIRYYSLFPGVFVPSSVERLFKQRWGGMCSSSLKLQQKCFLALVFLTSLPWSLFGVVRLREAHQSLSPESLHKQRWPSACAKGKSIVL